MTSTRRTDPAKSKFLGSFVFLAVVLATVTAQGQVYTVLYNYGSTKGDPLGPGALTQGTDGRLYGPSGAGGAHNTGSVFAMTTNGGMKVLYSAPPSSTYGLSSFTLSSDGRFYGAMYWGGEDNEGAILEFVPRQQADILYSFDDFDGANPLNPPVEGLDGNLVGTTYHGGSATCDQPCGTVYKLTPGGQLTTLYEFNEYDGGYFPNNLILGSDGTFYGTTVQGSYDYQQGTVFRITPLGAFTTIHTFSDPNAPASVNPTSLIMADDGNLYGLTSNGGASGDGVAYRLTPTGDYTILHNFSYSDGQEPFGLLQANDGNLYGVAASGGAKYGAGTIYRLTLDGSFSVLYNFAQTAGVQPSGLTQDTNGILYGNTTSGGSKNDGVFFSFDLGLSPFVRLLPPWGQPGYTIEILGQGLTGTSAVSFNGTPATYKVVSDTYLTAVVPGSVSNGKVTVTTPSGILTSNTSFNVVQ